MRPRYLACGHGLDRAIVYRSGRGAHCWRCDAETPLVRIPRIWRRFSRAK